MTTIVLVETTNEEISEVRAPEIVELAVTDLDLIGGGCLTGLVV